MDVTEFGFTECSVRLVYVRQDGVGRIVLMQRQTARRISPTSRLLVPTGCRDRHVKGAGPGELLRVDRPLLLTMRIGGADRARTFGPNHSPAQETVCLIPGFGRIWVSSGCPDLGGWPIGPRRRANRDDDPYLPGAGLGKEVSR